MKKHVSYSTIRNHSEDFRVEYEFLKKENGELIHKPFQGMRSDFLYADDDINEVGIYMIHPEFEDSNGEVITDLSQQINPVGTAKMWVLIDEMRKKIHCEKATVGVEGYFMSGSKRIAKVKIIEIVDLNKNIS